MERCFGAARAVVWALRCAPYLFCIAIAAVTILSLIPGNAVPVALQFWDKAQHTLAFALLTVLGGLAFPRRVKWVVLGLVAYGALIEVMQATLTTTRFGDAVDWVADTIGVAAGAAIHFGGFYRLWLLRQR